MDKNNRRSSLRQPPTAKEDDQTAPTTTRNSLLKRRISFSGKKSVREFVNTEEPHYWDNSYELSDHTNGEDSRERASKTGPCQQTPTADKENIPLQCEYESTRIDSTLNLRTSIGMDVPMFPYEKSRNTRSETKPNSTVSRESLYAESFSLSTIGRDKLKDAMYNHRIMDKTIDLMHISSKARDDCSLELSSFEKEQMKTQPTRSVSDSFMDITPLGIADPVPPPAAAAAASAKQSFMDLEQEFLNCSHQRLTTKATENINPVQNAGYMEMEESRKESQRQADASFDCDMNVSDARDRLPSNGSFETESNNSTINYLGDESVLIPYDMISGKNISKKLTFRQLNDELEAGKIKVLVNGPRTPTTDRSTKQKRFWHGLHQDQDQDPMGINIRSIKPRGTLNFSENMTMSPLAQATPVAARGAVELPREKLMVPPPDDKRKYRLSQADEMMLDNTNFLAHAKLGDETQSRNNSKSFTRRETTYENSELDLGLPCRQVNSQPSTIQQEAASKHAKPRQTINLPAEMEQDVFQLEEAAAAAIPTGRSCARRTLHMNESMDQEATTHQQRMKSRQVVESVREEIVCQSEENVPHKGSKSKRRETLLMEVSMEEDIRGPTKEVLLKGNAPTIAEQSKARHTLPMAEPLERDETLPGNAAAEPVEAHQPMGYQSSRAGQTILQAEPIEEDAGTNVPQPPAPVWVRTKTKRRETLLMEESMEEDIISPLKELHLKASAPTLAKGESKARQTLHLAEPLEEDETNSRSAAANGAIRKSYVQLPAPEPVEAHQPRSKARQTILQAEPIEVDEATIRMDKPTGNQRGKSRHTLLSAEPIEEDVMAPKSTLQQHSAGQQRSKSRHTLLMSEPIEEDTNQAREQPRLRSTNKEENLPIEEDFIEEEEVETKRIGHSTVYRSFKSRHTLLLSEPIEEDHTKEHQPTEAVTTGYRSSKSRQTLIMSEPIEEDQTKEQPLLTEKSFRDVAAGYRSSKSRQTLIMSEPIDEETSTAYQSSKPRNTRESKEKIPSVASNSRNTLLVAEPIEENFTAIKTSKARQTLLLATSMEEEKEEEKPLTKPPLEGSTKVATSRGSRAQQTMIMSESMEEEKEEEKPLTKPPLEGSTKVATSRGSRAQQTMIMSESMEEEKEEEKPLTKPPLEGSTKVATSRGFRAQQTIVMAESMEEEAEEEEDDFHSPLQSCNPSELLPITPMQKQNRSTSGNSMNEFEEFEEETNRSAVPRGPLQALLLRKRSMYQSVKMDLEGEASGLGTPIRHSGHAKRLPTHLTPNLPESKKRNTHLFADSKMLEVEQQQEAMELSASIQEVASAAAVNKSRIPIRDSIKMENFNETVQPVRDCQGLSRQSRLSRQSHVMDDSDVIEVLPPPPPPPPATAFEERHITISDVSTYFQCQPWQVKKEPAGTMTEQEPREQRNSGNRDSGSSTDRSFKSYAPTNQRFINLSGDTTIFSAALVENIDMDEQETNPIDHVRLSLVSTLADEPDTDEEAPNEGAEGMPAQPEPQPCQEQKERSRVVAAGSSASCRKCANCRRSLNDTKLSNDSFVLPSLPEWDLTREIQMLRRVRQKPNLDDVTKYWQIKEHERQTNALEHALDNSTLEEGEEEEEAVRKWDVNEVLAAYKMTMEGFKRNLAGSQEVIQQIVEPPEETFFDRLEDLLGEQQPNWIFDYQLKVSRKLIFTHRLLATFRLIVDYETVDEMETAIRVCYIEVERATAGSLQQWTAFEHLLDFQLQLKLPVNLTNSIEGNSVEEFAQFLQCIDTICVDIKRTFHKLLKVLTTTRASLLRQANRMVIKKTVRRHIEVDKCTRIEKTDFVMEIANVERISFTDILQPKLHFFSENIQFLPKGVAFLEAFLDHPEQYLKA